MKGGLLEIVGLVAHYGDFQALFGVDLTVSRGEIVALIGANGAGKSTLLNTISGLVPSDGQHILFAGRSIAGLPAHQIARAGIALAPEGRRLFASLSVRENIEVGAFGRRSGPWDMAAVSELFPIIGERADTPASLLSGGQQQMVAIARALVRNPELLLLDEISLGLAPVVTREIYASLAAIRQAGTAVIVVEQDIALALAEADRFYCLQKGRIRLSGRPGEVDRDAISAAYFGREVTG